MNYLIKNYIVTDSWIPLEVAIGFIIGILIVLLIIMLTIIKKLKDK